MTTDDLLRPKRERLKEILAGYGGCLIAYSGGVDSTCLLAAAREVLGDRCRAVTVRTIFHPPGEVADAALRAHALGARHEVLELELGEQDEARRNPPDRCYHCKHMIFTALGRRARELGLPVLVEATHVDDLGERRPGIRALEELGVGSPLLEAGLRKEEIRRLSREMGLPGSERHSRPCLATRFPYGTPLDEEMLVRVAAAEDVLERHGFRAGRVRDYGPLARIELRQGGLPEIVKDKTRQSVIEGLTKLGYRYVAVDLMGYRSGSMDEVLTPPLPRRRSEEPDP